jgi:hypothetical protein
MFCASRRRSDISILSDLSGLFDDEKHYADEDKHLVRSEAKSPNIYGANSQGEDYFQDKDKEEEKLQLQQTDTNDARSQTTSLSENRHCINSDDQIIVTQLICLDLSKNLPKTNEEKATHCTTCIRCHIIRLLLYSKLELYDCWFLRSTDQ